MSKKTRGITVVGVAVSNFHRIRVASVKMLPGAGLVRITGKNGSGKTSLLRSLRAALGGAGEVLSDAVVNEASEDGKGSVTLELSNGFTVERRFTEANPKGYLSVTGPDGGKHAQAKLDEWLGPLAFDPLAFYDLKPERQNEILLSLGSPDLPGELEALRERQKAIRDERTPWIVRKREAMKVAEPEGERPEPIDTSAELEKLEALQARNRERQDSLARGLELQGAKERNDLNLERVAEQIEAVREKLRELEGEEDRLEERARRIDAELEAWEDEHEILEEVDEEIVLCRARLRQAQEIDAALRPWVAYESALADVELARNMERELTEELDRVIGEERELIASAALPVDGLSFTDEGPLLNGRPLSVASGAERIRLAVAVALAANPELRIALVDEANDVDLEGLQALDALAQEHGFQVWACRIGLEGPGEIVVDDGEAFGSTDE